MESGERTALQLPHLKAWSPLAYPHIHQLWTVGCLQERASFLKHFGSRRFKRRGHCGLLAATVHSSWGMVPHQAGGPGQSTGCIHGTWHGWGVHIRAISHWERDRGAEIWVWTCLGAVSGKSKQRSEGQPCQSVSNASTWISSAENVLRASNGYYLPDLSLCAFEFVTPGLNPFRKILARCLGIYPKLESVGHWVWMHWGLADIAKELSRMTVHLILLWAVYKSSSCPTSLSLLGIVCLFHFSSSGRHIVFFHREFHLHLSDD